MNIICRVQSWLSCTEELDNSESFGEKYQADGYFAKRKRVFIDAEFSSKDVWNMRKSRSVLLERKYVRCDYCLNQRSIDNVYIRAGPSHF